jgi:uncharacterized protein
MDYGSALRLLEDCFGDGRIARHCRATANKAVEIAERIKASGRTVDMEFVRVGALLHDIGRARTHDIEHNYEGGRMLRELGFERLARAVERHGSNIFEVIRPDELTLEEKIVYLADKLTEEDRYVSLDERFKSVVERRMKTGREKEVMEIRNALGVTKMIESELRGLM